MTLRTSVCQHCRKPLTFVQYHAGFSDQGFLYCGKDGTVLTWSSYDRHYTAVAMDKHPWMLDDDERDRVEKRLRRCPCGGTFAFRNPPLCRHCLTDISSLVSDSDHYIVVGKRIDGDDTAMWT